MTEKELTAKELAKQKLKSGFKQVELELISDIFSIAQKGMQKNLLKQLWNDYKEATTENMLEVVEMARQEQKDFDANELEGLKHKIQKETAKQIFDEFEKNFEDFGGSEYNLDKMTFTKLKKKFLGGKK